MKQILILLIFSILTSPIFAGGRPSSVKKPSGYYSNGSLPEWISNPSSLYNEKLYLTGVGFGTSDNAAEDDAKSELIKTLDQKISSTESIKNFASNSEDVSIYTANIDTSTQIKSITGLKITEKYHASDSKVYALAVLKRQDVADYYGNLISKHNSQIEEYLSFANSNLGTIESCIYAQNAFYLAQEIEYYTYLINTIDAPFEQDINLSYGSFVKLTKNVSDIKSKVSINVKVDNDDKNRLKNSFVKAFNTLGLRATETENAQYSIIAKFDIEKTESPDEKHVYLNYYFTVDFICLESNTILHSYSSHGRTGHLNEQGAYNKTLVALSNEIEGKFLDNLSALLGANK